MVKNDPTDIWAWVHEDMERLLEEGGAGRTIVENYYDYMNNLDNDPALAEMAIATAISAARETGKVRWELFLRHWRFQLWLRQNELKRMLPEAIDLLSLAIDERVRDVPQRICAFHDIVECYVEMDGVGYYDEIVENAQDVLAQLPQKHPCATCARLNIAIAAAQSKRVEEAERWHALTEAHMEPRSDAEFLINRAAIYENIARWDEAERLYLNAREQSQKRQERTPFLEATLSLVRVYLAKGNVQDAIDMLLNARRVAKYGGGPWLLARLLEAEGYVAEAHQEIDGAVDYFACAAREFLNMGGYRNAALTSLHGAEIARAASLPSQEIVLEIAAEAVGMLPPASRDVYERLAALGKNPVFSTLIQPMSLEIETADRNELSALEDLLRVNMANGQVQNVASALYRLGCWHRVHKGQRAAVDYFIWNAALERLLKLSMQDREDALGSLSALRKELPAGAVDAALLAAESAPPALLSPLLGEISLARWRWLLRAIAIEVMGRPVVEPEPDDEGENGEERFNAWLNRCAEMVALIVRFRGQYDVAQCENWTQMLDQNADGIEQQSRLEDAENQKVGQALNSLVRGLAALSRGASIEETVALVPPAFAQLIHRIEEAAKRPVWQHPGSTPLDFMIEIAAQRAVEALRQQDERRQRRLENLTFRYKMMNLDLRQQEELQPVAHFLDALCALLQADGQSLPVLEPALQPPFDTLLVAVYEAGKHVVVEKSEE